MANIWEDFFWTFSFKKAKIKTKRPKSKRVIQNFDTHPKKPLSSGYRRRLMFQRLWVWILATFTGWTFIHIYYCENCNVCLKKTKINNKRPRMAHFFKKTHFTIEKFKSISFWLLIKSFSKRSTKKTFSLQTFEQEEE